MTIAHPIRLRNSASGEAERFTPRDWRDPAIPEDERRVRMYVCGPTVYDRVHVGNARPAVVFDVLFRLLRHVYGEDRVVYVRNVTDVEDKINARAKERWPEMDPLEAIARLTRETTAAFHADMDALDVLRPTHEPKATDHVPAMVEMIALLIERGHAYEAEGHVLFSVASYPAYGALSGRSTEDMIAGARVEVAPYKRDPMDFVLWKPSGPDEPGWESPWGRGRPGWHIECSAMSEALLGPDFDIHGGGSDLMFPHHENEIAQSHCAHPDHAFAEVWLHNGMINVDGRKMSKSLGNFVTVAEALEELPGEVIRLGFLMTHYRDVLNWGAKRRQEARKKLERWRLSLARRGSDWVAARPEGPAPAAVMEALSDDLNTPGAVAALDELAKAARIRERTVEAAAAAEALAGGMRLLGLDPFADGAVDRLAAEEEGTLSDAMRAGGAGAEQAGRIRALLDARAEARKAKDFARADAIRDAVAAAGVIVKDTPQGAEWELGPDFDPTKLEDVE
ncbi:MAG: cysteine--tRNA ligase [Paracoccaceae bacterium]